MNRHTRTWTEPLEDFFSLMGIALVIVACAYACRSCDSEKSPKSAEVSK